MSYIARAGGCQSKGVLTLEHFQWRAKEAVRICMW